MNETTHGADLLAATRFVQAGRLSEATALLQRLLRGEPGHVAGDTVEAPPSTKAGVIDLTPETLEVTAPRRESPAMKAVGTGMGHWPSGGMAPPAQATMPEALRGFLERFQGSGLEAGLGGLTGLATPTPDILPDGARFLAGSYGNQAGSRAYKLYVPSTYHGQTLPLVVMLHGCTQSPDDFAAGTRHEPAGRGAWLPGRLPGPVRLGQHLQVLELVQGGGPAARRRRALADRGHHPPDHGGVSGRPAAGLCRRALGRRGGGRGHGRDLSRSLRRGRRALRSRRRRCQGHAVRLRRHAGRRRTTMPSQSGTATAVGEGRMVPTIVFHGDQDRTVNPRNGDQVIAQARSAATVGLQATATAQQGQAPGGRSYRRTAHADAAGRAMLEQWVIHGAGHAWAGGSPAGSYTDPQGPDASREMLRFFLEHPHPTAGRRMH